MKRLLIASLVLALPLAHAEFLTGNSLLARMTGDDAELLFAQGYVTGVFDAGRGAAHCPPNNVTIGQIVAMTRKRLEAVPELRHLTADVLITNHLKTTWPCGKASQAPNT